MTIDLVSKILKSVLVRANWIKLIHGLEAAASTAMWIDLSTVGLQRKALNLIEWNMQ